MTNHDTDHEVTEAAKAVVIVALSIIGVALATILAIVLL